ncbi:MAG: hypothetical protein QUS13_05910 [Smithella sp.]|nr:hypothetical protein [Smithella sp.]
MKMKRFLLVVLSLLLLLAFMGCSDDTNNSSVTNPNPKNFNPKGYIQGKVVDSCTLQPISGAVIDIGVAKATTDANGQYMMANVPATTYYDHTIGGEIDVELNWSEDNENPYGGLYLSEADVDVLLAGETSGWLGAYSATIDMSKAKVVVDVNSATGKLLNLTKTTAVPVTQAPLKYASRYYNVVTVVFSSLKESDGNVSTVSNHDTPVDKVGSGNFDFLLGQLTSGISGDAVWGATYDAATGKIALMPVRGYAVALYTVLGEENFGNSSTGSIGHRVALTTTDQNGHFSFTGLETARAYIVAVADGSPAKYSGYVLAHTMCDNDMLSFNIQDGKAIHVYSTDVVCPFIQLVTIDGKGPYVDLSKEEIADGVDIVLTFSEPIKATNLNTGRALLNTTDYLTGTDATMPGLARTLYHDIAVNFEGFKASNIPHTLAWNATMTALTIHIDAQYLQPASAYSVRILSGQNLKDENGNSLRYTVGHQNRDLSAVVYDSADYDCADEISISNWGIFFTTYGVIPAGAVTDLKVMPVTPYTNARTAAAQLPYELQYDQEAKLDWNAVLGAKSYNVYCRLIQWNSSFCNNDPCDPQCTTTGQYHPYVLIKNVVDTHTFTDFQGIGSFYNLKYNMDEDNWEYVERDYIKLSYQCYVRGVDADGIEGPNSNVVLIEDTVNPLIISGTTPLSEGATVSSIQVCFSEPMNEASVENATWTLSTTVWDTTTYPAPTLLDVDYWTSSSFCARFILSGPGVLTSNATAFCAANSTACNVPVLSLTAGNIVDVAGNPLVIGTNLPIMLHLVTP